MIIGYFDTINFNAASSSHSPQLDMYEECFEGATAYLGNTTRTHLTVDCATKIQYLQYLAAFALYSM